MRVFITMPAKTRAGGSKTFTAHFVKFLLRRGHTATRFAWRAQAVLVIANYGNPDALRKARDRGCPIVHRIDEHIESPDYSNVSEKHKKLKILNGFASTTVFQSRFVHDNMMPYIQPARWRIIHNGTDTAWFSPAVEPGRYVGHASWSVAPKKRLDLLRGFILAHPEERFLLVGNHAQSPLDFNLPNATMLGPVENSRMNAFYRQLKMLYFPSENDPCPNTVVESMACGVPVCYNTLGGTRELVQGAGDVPPCGEPLDRVEMLMADLSAYRARCRSRRDLDFEAVAEQYLGLLLDRSTC